MQYDTDEFLCFLQGQGNLTMGEDQLNPMYNTRVNDNLVAIVPAGMWHRLTNTGLIPLKLYSISTSGIPRTYTGF
ncbi:MAG: hypothetical protein ACOYIA_02490 [Eubacteriales bacterium]|jgi:mannose-6-phosphate isomerase-like protein (cupin superfamily)